MYSPSLPQREDCDNPAGQRVTIAIHAASEHSLPDSKTIDRIVESFYDQLSTLTVELRVVPPAPCSRGE